MRSGETRAVLERLLPRVLTGVQHELNATMAVHGPGALALIPRSVELIRFGADLAFDCAREDQLIGQETLSPYEKFGHVVADGGFSADSLRLGVTTSYTAAMRIALAEASVSDRATLMPLVMWSAQLGPLVEDTELGAFFHWHQQRAETGRYREQVVRSLLSGSAAGVGTRAPAHLVALVSPAVSRGDPAGKLARLERTLLDSGALVLARKQFVVLLHPLPAFDGPGVRVPEHVSALDSLGPGVHVALAKGSTQGLLGAFREAMTVWQLVRSRGYPAGFYDLSHVLTDRLVSGEPDIATRLHGILAPLADSPVLLDTLRAWVLGNADRRRVAAALHVHPNTLDRRLRHIEQRTGLSVSRYHDLHLLHLALAALSVRP
ncbi:helix-turn-helix domain-containing protein [Amycolatopsis sp. FU40]|uniref:PucR family transcriptional regulator n=1 Tax=Amycolatopsis sp. FU40 TaxID=2914159 RepID=UPI001F15F3EC|nr:helix-turn-helix domain-containing protein [Amycolatopsis sp. FU40]UKD51782.1 helix-turn-helix domain-containing protein [Amycolatopsis sp. FU40]